MIYNVTELRNYGVVCVPYLDRLFHQLQRDEPESVIQISEKLMGNTTSKDSNSSRFHNIDQTFYGWGDVEHKFLINSKLFALRDILNCGVDAFITDTDIGFKGDPRPYFDIKGANGDVIAQNDTNDNYKLSLNSGFMYWRNTRDNRELIEDIITGKIESVYSQCIWICLCLISCIMLFTIYIQLIISYIHVMRLNDYIDNSTTILACRSSTCQCTYA